MRLHPELLYVLIDLKIGDFVKLSALVLEIIFRFNIWMLLWL